MEENIDKLIEDIETLSTEISQINFNIDGLTEDIQELEEKRPFMVRQLQVNTRKLQKLSGTLMRNMRLKQDLDARLSAYQIAHAPTPKDKPNIEETPKA